MKQIVALFLLFLSAKVYAQELKCCNSEEEVKSFITGDWKLKNIDHQSYFQYHFSENEASCSIIQIFDSESENEKTIKHQAAITVLKDDEGYIIEWDSERFHWASRILKLKSRKITLEINGSLLEFKKLKLKE